MLSILKNNHNNIPTIIIMIIFAIIFAIIAQCKRLPTIFTTICLRGETGRKKDIVRGVG